MMGVRVRPARTTAAPRLCTTQSFRRCGIRLDRSVRGASANRVADGVAPLVAWLARGVVQQDHAIAEAVRVDERER